MKCFLAFFILFFLFPAARGASALPHGYIQDVQAEREERYSEVFLFAEPPPRSTNLRNLIFNAELSSEFRERYRDRFGQLDTESVVYQRSDYDRLDKNKGNNPAAEEENSRRRSYAEYMMKRLTEWHVDNYIKSEPAMRPVYEVKEKLKKVEVKVTKQTKLEARYSLAGNILDLILDNPYVDSKWTLQMDPGAVGPSSIEENRISLAKPLSSTVRVENYWTDRDARTGLSLIKSHTPQVSSTYGISAAVAESRYSGESRIGLGFGYSF